MSSYFRARRKRGACYGTLWKQHSSVSTPPNLSSFKEQAKRNHGRSNKNNASSLDGSAGSRGDKNFSSRKETSIRSDYMNMIAGELGEDDVEKELTTSSNQRTSIISLAGPYKALSSKSAGVETLSAALEKNERAKCYEFCALIGNTLTCYESLTAFRRGDDPSSEVRIVGASAWNPPSVQTKNRRTPRSSSPSLRDSSSPTNANSSPTFRLLTNAGTHIYCSAQTNTDRDIWLTALHSGLEITYAGFKDTLTTLSSLSSSVSKSSETEKIDETQLGSSTSTLKKITPLSSSMPPLPSSPKMRSSSKVLEPTILTPPLPKRNRANIQKFVKRITSNQSSHGSSNIASANPFLNPYEVSTSPFSKIHCISCGRYPPEDIVKPYNGTPLPQYGLENIVSNICQPCLVGQGVLRHVMSITGLYVSDAHERVALVRGLELMSTVLKRIEDEGSCVDSESSSEEDEESDDNCDEKKEKNEGVNNAMLRNNERKAKLDSEMINLLDDSNFAACRRRSRTLDHISNQLSRGEIVTAEFIDKLNEYANDATGGGAGEENGAIGNDSMHETMQMKKEALMIAGDMRAAIEILREHALPKRNTGSGYGIGTSATKGGTEMLSCILEFFLDLCEQGELSSVAFFWTQICQIHMQMLPPTDTESLIRIELVEDFLITVCVQHSVHLALELVWSCLADVEESFGTESMPSASCRRRRFAMLRFICELESLIFDIEGGWGGGSVCLRGMLSPSDQQSALIKDAMDVLQLHRRLSSHHLTRSARLDKLRLEAVESLKVAPSAPTSEQAVMDAAQRKYQIARNAEYFSTQLMFCRRLGDIAERLFFMEVDERKEALKQDLEMLNASGRLGGDPLNKICDESSGLVNVMHIPSTEGHVFRSKERTPVLLLMEIISDQKIFESTPNSPKKILVNENKSGPKEDFTIEMEEISTKGQNDLPSSDICEDSSSIPSRMEESEDNGQQIEEADLLGLNTSKCPPSPKVLPSPKIIVDGETKTKEVGNMVANMIHEQLKMVPFPELETTKSNDSFLSCNSQQNLHEKDGNDSDKDDQLKPEEAKNSDATNECNTDCNSSAVSEKIKETTIDEEGNNCNSDLTTEPAHVSEDLLLPEVNGDASNTAIARDINQEESDILTTTTEKVDSPSQTERNETGRETIETNNQNEDPVNIDGDINAREEELLEGFQAFEPTNDNSSMTTSKEEKISIDTNVMNDKSSSLTRKVSAFGSFSDMPDGSKGQSNGIMANLNFSANGEGRRHVLNTIFVKGMRSSNLIAREVAPVARRAVQAMDRKRAQLLMSATNRGRAKDVDDSMLGECATSLNSLDISIMDKSEQNTFTGDSSEEDECVEAVRLLLVQNRVALGKLTPENAALTLDKAALDEKRHGSSEDDAGNVDDRLAGCGPVSNAILSAVKLWKDGMVSNGELLELVQKDLQFTKITLPGTKNETILIEDSAFWGRFAFGERWAEKKSRIQSSSTLGAQPGWDLTGVIVKSNDDLRQEAFAMQLIELCKEAFEIADLELWIQPYRILATGRTTGIIEMVRNAMSFDSLKKRPGYNEGGLLGHFKRMAEHAADPVEALNTAKKNFVRSLAAYSLLSYLFLFKDRHNGNLLLDTAGHVIHIDFGFIFGIAPGGSFSLESSVPFKLTDEMIEVMGGLGSVLFSEFVTLFCCGYLALQAHAETFVTIVKITCEGSNFKCFEGKDNREIVSKLRERFCTDMNKEATIAHAMELIRQATNATGTKQYDFFQYLSQGIAA